MDREYFKRHCERNINLVGKGPEKSLTLREVSEDFKWWDVIAEFTFLERLIIYGGAITSLDKRLSELKNIKHLGVRQCPLNDLPMFLFDMPKLEVIYFQCTSIKELPPYIFQHPSVKEMHLEANKIKKLPELAYPNYNLRKISLSNNCISSIPESFLAMLPNLEMLNLAKNPLSGLTT